jgi:hypothetical protein
MIPTESTETLRLSAVVAAMDGVANLCAMRPPDFLESKLRCASRRPVSESWSCFIQDLGIGLPFFVNDATVMITEVLAILAILTTIFSLAESLPMTPTRKLSSH